MIKHEQKWQTIWNQYIREKQLYGFFELKQTILDSFPFSKIETVQYDGLQATEKHGLVWKFSDEDQRPKPCDSVSIPPLPSYLVIKFRDGFYMIRFQKIVENREAGRISITRLEAEKLAEKIIKINK
jgi:hypothetical protein